MYMSDPTLSANRTFSVICHYFSMFESSFRELGCEISDLDIERLTVEIVRAMGSEQRDYHKPEHSLDVSKNNKPIPRIAGIFHDSVYVQVDPSWRINFKEHLNNFIPTEDFRLNAKAGFEAESSVLRKAIIILFGMEQTSAVIPGKGINEVLSTLVMEHMLSKHLTSKEILSIAACIEATIPFRKIDADGKTSSDRLKVRLDKAGELIKVKFTDNEKNEIVEWCKEVVEHDLASFASFRLNTFISNTWNVMNENNPALRNTFFYVSEYRKAVYGVIPFLNSLDPEQMFWSSKDSLALDVFTREMLARTYKNLKWGVEYLKVVGLSLSIIEAVAMETGGDLPYETLVGPTRKSREHMPISIGAFLPSTDYRNFSEGEKEVFLVLKNGRELRARFDRKECPLGAFLYQNLSSVELDMLYGKAMDFHNHKFSTKEFLLCFRESMLTDIVKALSQSSLIRSISMHNMLLNINPKRAA